MSPYQLLRRLAFALIERKPDAGAAATFMSGFELGMKMHRSFPVTAAKLIESIDIEAHGGDTDVGGDTLVSLVNDIAQLRQN